MDMEKSEFYELITGWFITAKEMRELAEKHPNDAVMWLAAASAWEQAARELTDKLQ
jgi:PIN domain nuclease of toxin-antitoxin system